MQGGWTAAIVLAGLALGLRWLAETATGARAEQQGGEQGPGWALPRDPLPSASSLSLPRGAENAREPEPLVAARTAELARAHWVAGRVNLPAGTPADEVCFVVAEGRPFADGTTHRARVEPDGRFRVAFSPDAKAGWIDVEGRYLFLRRRSRWLRAEAAEEVTLAPELGGVVRGRLHPPAGRKSGALDGEIALIQFPRRRAALRAGGEFVLERVPCDDPVALLYRDDDWLLRSPPLTLVPGGTEQLELELVPGVALGGKVRDARGRAIAGARITVSGSPLETRTGRNGRFRLPALEAGERTLSVSCAGYLPAKRDLGSFAAGERRLDLALALARGATIAGTVFAPDGSPAIARVRVASETGEPPGRSWVYTESASDGTFLLQGLAPGSYRLEAWKVQGSGKVDVRPLTIAAGTRSLVLHLGAD